MRFLITIGEVRAGEVECAECAPVDLRKQVDVLINEHGANPDTMKIWKQADVHIGVKHVDFALDGSDPDLPPKGG